MFGDFNIGDIVEGHWNEFTNQEQELSTKRLSICRNCPLYSNSPLGPICDAKKCFNIKENQLTTEIKNENVICGCGCRLSAKTTLKHAHCILNKW